MSFFALKHRNQSCNVDDLVFCSADPICPAIHDTEDQKTKHIKKVSNKPLFFFF